MMPMPARAIAASIIVRVAFSDMIDAVFVAFNVVTFLFAFPRRTQLGLPSQHSLLTKESEF